MVSRFFVWGFMPNDYNGSQIGVNGLHKARYMIGDTGRLLDKNNEVIWLLSDDEVTAAISGGFNEGVATLCDGLINRFAQEPDRYEDEANVKLEWVNRLKGWESLARRLRLIPSDGATGGSQPPTAVSGIMADPSGTSKLGV